MDDVTTSGRTPWLPPRWFVRLAWIIHRAIHRLTGGRRGLAVPRPGKAGYLRLHTVGRRSGPRAAGDRRVLRGRSGPGDTRDERLGGSRAGMVAQPARGIPTRGSTSRAALAPSAHAPRRAMNARDSGRASTSSGAGGPTSTPLPGSDRERPRWSSSSRAPSPPEVSPPPPVVASATERRLRGLAAGSLRAT